MKLQDGIPRPFTQDTAKDGFLGLLSICSLFCHHFWRAMFYLWKQTGSWEKIDPFSKLSFSHPLDRRIWQKKTSTCLPIISLELHRDWHSFYGGEKQKEDRPGHYLWDMAASSERVQQGKPYSWLPASPHVHSAEAQAHVPKVLVCSRSGVYLCKKKIFSVSFQYDPSIIAST